MSWFSKKPSSPRSPSHDFLAQDYGLTRTAGGWSYNGRVVEALAEVGSPEVCLAVLKEAHAQGEGGGFDSVCIVAGTPAFLVLNMDPPCGFKTALDSEGMAALIAAIMKSSGSKVLTYEGVWVVRIA